MALCRLIGGSVAASLSGDEYQAKRSKGGQCGLERLVVELRRPGACDVIVILLAWNRFSNQISEEIKKHSKEFGHLMAYKGVLVMPYDDRKEAALNEVLEKDWSEDIMTGIQAEHYPFLLTISRDFREFDAKVDKFAFVWFADMKGNEENVWKAFDTIARKVSRKEDIFGDLAALAEQQKQSKFTDQLAALPKYAETKVPIIPGVILGGNHVR